MKPLGQTFDQGLDYEGQPRKRSKLPGLAKKKGIRRIALVTYMPRASADFRNAGFEVVSAALGQLTIGTEAILSWIPSTTNLEVGNNVILQLLAQLVQRVRG